LDISKAFDIVSWPFLLEVLQHLGFGRRRCNLICLILSTASTQVLVNGIPGHPLITFVGCGKVTPLSPFLFLLVMDVLSSLIRLASRNSPLQPIAGQQHWPQVSLYVNDVVIFLRPNYDDLCTIRDLLHGFGHVFGLKTNLIKSSDILACSGGSFRCTYLGIPLTIHKPSKADFIPLIDKVARMQGPSMRRGKPRAPARRNLHYMWSVYRTRP
jgi:hypothetical protein